MTPSIKPAQAPRLNSFLATAAQLNPDADGLLALSGLRLADVDLVECAGIDEVEAIGCELLGVHVDPAWTTTPASTPSTSARRRWRTLLRRSRCEAGRSVSTRPSGWGLRWHRPRDSWSRASAKPAPKTLPSA